MRSKIRVPSHCKICSASALYSYYGVIACHSCKIFFKRNAENNQANLKCDFDYHCEINIKNRHICAYCRLIKCFANGMRAEMIRHSKNKMSQKKNLISDSIRTTLRKTIEEKQPEQISTLNLLRSDQSTLTIYQWNLLSNLIHYYDEYGEHSLIQRYIQQQNALPVKLRFKYSSAGEFLAFMMGNIQLAFEKNRDLLSLSSHDRTTLLRNTVEYRTSFGGIFMSRQHQLFNYPSFYNSLEIIFNQTAVAFSKRTINQLDPDDTFLKIIFAIMAFSTTNCTIYTKLDPINLTDIKKVLSIQNVYVELAWRYILYKYGHHQAVIRFSNLIRCLLFLNRSIAEAHESKQFAEMIDTVIEQTEQILCL